MLMPTKGTTEAGEVKMPPFTVYAVDDEENIRTLLHYNLKTNGYDVHTFRTGEELFERTAVKKPDLFILDIMLPGIDGMEICRTIRSEKELKFIPVIMLTAKGEEIDTVLGLELGADDYISKPFSVRELMARIKSVMRRTAESSKPEEKVSAGGIDIDFQRHEVRKGNILIEMTPKEYDLLKILIENRGRVLTRELLLEKVWGYEFAGETRTIDVHIRNLRRKIGEDAIITYRGYGYKFRDIGESV